jgi:hypothetical protein
VDGVPHYVRPVCPRQFVEEVYSDFMAFDMSGSQYQKNEVSGEEVRQRPDNDLTGATVGVVWNDDYVSRALCPSVVSLS